MQYNWNGIATIDNSKSRQADGNLRCRWPCQSTAQVCLLYEGYQSYVPLSFTREDYSISSKLLFVNLNLDINKEVAWNKKNCVKKIILKLIVFNGCT